MRSVFPVLIVLVFSLSLHLTIDLSIVQNRRPEIISGYPLPRFIRSRHSIPLLDPSLVLLLHDRTKWHMLGLYPSVSLDFRTSSFYRDTISPSTFAFSHSVGNKYTREKTKKTLFHGSCGHTRGQYNDQTNVRLWVGKDQQRHQSGLGPLQEILTPETCSETD